MSYKEDLYINKHQVVDLWTDHADRFLKWGEVHADAIEERDLLKDKITYETSILKDNLDFIKADLSNEYKNNYKEYGLSKVPSDKQVEAYYLRHSKYQAAQLELRDATRNFNTQLISAEHKVNVTKIAKEAFEHRAKALDGLTKLLTGGFYSARLPVSLKEEVEEKKYKEVNEQAYQDTQESMENRRRSRKHVS